MGIMRFNSSKNSNPIIEKPLVIQEEIDLPVLSPTNALIETTTDMPKIQPIDFQPFEDKINNQLNTVTNNIHMLVDNVQLDINTIKETSNNNIRAMQTQLSDMVQNQQTSNIIVADKLDNLHTKLNNIQKEVQREIDILDEKYIEELEILHHEIVTDLDQKNLQLNVKIQSLQKALFMTQLLMVLSLPLVVTLITYLLK